jgi:hypothetical protein
MMKIQRTRHLLMLPLASSKPNDPRRVALRMAQIRCRMTKLIGEMETLDKKRTAASSAYDKLSEKLGEVNAQETKDPR